MNKKKEIIKNLKKRISLVIEIYVGIRGKKKKKLMRAFIDEKVNEIVAYKQALLARKDKSKSDQKQEEGDAGVKETMDKFRSTTGFLE